METSKAAVDALLKEHYQTKGSPLRVSNTHSAIFDPVRGYIEATKEHKGITHDAIEIGEFSTADKRLRKIVGAVHLIGSNPARKPEVWVLPGHEELGNKIATALKKQGVLRFTPKVTVHENILPIAQYYKEFNKPRE